MSTPTIYLKWDTAGERNHFKACHPKTYKCLLGPQCEYGAWCKSAQQHIRMLELHNDLVAPTLLNRFRTLTFPISCTQHMGAPSGTIQSRMDTARKTYELEHANHPDSPFSGKHTTEIWYMVGQCLDTATLSPGLGYANAWNMFQVDRHTPQAL